MKHTPGPWLIAVGLKTFVYALTGGGTNRFWTQVSGSADLPQEEAEANARLIAAAPDLLEALQEVVAAADLGGWLRLDPGLKNQRAAVAKARGEVTP